LCVRSKTKIKAVDKRMLAADVPIGVLLSGGLDSSLLVGLLHEAGHSDIRTFSIGFEDICIRGYQKYPAKASSAP
jgi:asparagine synthetase B (glutamine-hydrolysing)